MLALLQGKPDSRRRRRRRRWRCSTAMPVVQTRTPGVSIYYQLHSLPLYALG